MKTKLAKTFVIATVAPRIDGLKNLVKQINLLYPEWQVSIVAQQYTKPQKDDLEAFLKSGANKYNVEYHENLIGAHTSKVHAIKNMPADVYCSLDDDMELCALTKYDEIVKKLFSDRGIGIITGNWVRTFEQIESKKISDDLVKQKLVFTGGGLLFRSDVAKIICGIPDKEYLFDDCLWAVYAYVNGYENYRYMGSLAVHHICGKNGLRTWIETGNKKVLPPEEYLRVRKGHGKEHSYNEYLICTDSDVTKIARSMHEMNKLRFKKK